MINWIYLKENTRVFLYVISPLFPGRRQIHSRKICISVIRLGDDYDDDDDDNNNNSNNNGNKTKFTQKLIFINLLLLNILYDCVVTLILQYKWCCGVKLRSNKR
jgi:hypothetical protein